MADFRIAEAEFIQQLSIFRSLVLTVEICSRQDPFSPTQIGGAPLPLMGGNEQNTMAAAAIVLMAAHFEEYLRQQIESFGAEIVPNLPHMQPADREAFTDDYWRASQTKLSRVRPKGNPGWATSAQSIVQGLLEFPITGNIAAFDARNISEHDNNMRFETMIALCKRVSIKNAPQLLFNDINLKQALNNPTNSENMHTILKTEINEFYELRNNIVHNIAQTAGIGSTIVDKWASFFQLLATAFAGCFEKALVEVHVGFQRRQRAAGNP